MEACTIYRTKGNEFKIVPQCKTDAGYLLDVMPVHILSVDCPNDELQVAIIAALKRSAGVIKAPGREEFPAIQKALLHELKEPTYLKLYQKSASCSLTAQGGDLKIYPNKYMTEEYPKDGLVHIDEMVVVVEHYMAQPGLIVEEIRKLFNLFQNH